jgi:hypothetical protein
MRTRDKTAFLRQAMPVLLVYTAFYDDHNHGPKRFVIWAGYAALNAFTNRSYHLFHHPTHQGM